MIEKKNIKRDLLNLLKEKVYMGISAGSMVAGKFLKKELSNLIFPEEDYNGKEQDSIELINLSFIPHLNSEYFKEIRKEVLDNMRDKLEDNVYACDDEVALKIVDNNIEVIGEGSFWTSNKNFIR